MRNPLLVLLVLLLLPAVAPLGGCPSGGPFAAVAVGPGRVCGLLDDGSLRCAGGEDTWEEEQHAPPPSVAFVDISLGTAHGCGRDDAGVVHCFGPASAEVIELPEELRTVSFSRVSAGNGFSCGLRGDNGTLACWGFNPRVGPCPAEEPCPGLLDPPAGAFVAVALGDIGNTLCALDEEGRATCWGEGATDPPAERLRRIGAGASHACGVEGEGDVVCWGADGEAWTEPPDVSATAVVGGINHSCLLDEEGGVSCFGAGPAIDAAVPKATFIAIDAAGHQTCGLTAERAVSCWGLDSDTGNTAIASLP